MHWRDFAATLSPDDHRRLALALGAGLAEARKAAQVATDNGRVEDARRHVAAAIDWLSEARALLD